MDSTSLLLRVPLFANLSVDQRALVWQAGHVQDVPAGTCLSQQADPGEVLFLVIEGEAVVHHVDDQGRERPTGVFGPGDAYGTTGLFVRQPRDATVTARSSMRVWTLRRDALEELGAGHPDIWRALALPEEVLTRLRAPAYAWLQPDEQVVCITTRHWSALGAALCWPTVGLALAWGVLYALGRGGLDAPSAAWFVPAGLYLLVFAWHVLDWRNDYFAITTQRFAHRERVALWLESRDEAPLDRIQSVTVQRNAAGALLGYGDLTVETAAQEGRLRFTRIPRPEQMREALFEEITRARAAARAGERTRVRTALVQHLAQVSRRGTASEPAATDLPHGDPTPDSLELEIARNGVRPPDETPIGALALPRPGDPSTSQSPDHATWRRHWVFLVRALARPVGLLLVCGLLGWATGPGPAGQVGNALPLVPYLLLGLGIVPALWAWWEATDWANDRYMVTDRRIVHLERRPLMASEQRREANLDVVQNISLRVPDFWAGLLGYGDVLVQTAGVGEFVFHQVPNPRDVQREVFSRMEKYRAANQQREIERRRDEFVDWIAAYDELHHPGAQPDG